MDIPATDLALRILIICGTFKIAEPAMMAKPMPFETVTLKHSLLLKKSNLLKYRSKQSSLKKKSLNCLGVDYAIAIDARVARANSK